MNQNLNFNSPLVSVSWLHDHLGVPNLIILDATMDKVSDQTSKESIDVQIPKARFFDIKNKFSDTIESFSKCGSFRRSIYS